MVTKTRLAFTCAALCAALLLLAPPSLPAQESPPAESESESAGPADADQPEENTEASADADRTSLNLLGEVDSEKGESRRNENVRITLIDNNVLRELTTRMGTTATVTPELQIDQSYFSTEFGQPSKRPSHQPASGADRVHGNFYWTHQNSVFSARSFFQAGGVKPSRDNSYGFTVGVPLWSGAALTLNGSQGRSRGSVNGNVLVPAADERTPLTNDPATRAIVQRLLDAYPAELPNRTDINERALNTNDIQSIDNNRGSITLDQVLGERDRLTLRYGFTGQDVDAFQLVGGQNPDTTTKNHDAKITWNRSWTPATTTDVTAGYERVGSLIVPEETSVGPLILTGFVVEFLGPGSNIPIDRARNRFRYAARVRHARGRHLLTAGTELVRRQVNGLEAESHRGLFFFRNDFGNDAITNIRMGLPSVYRVAIGDTHRGFRNWDMQFYAADKWQVTSDLTFDFGLRYEPVTRPAEVNGLTEIPYDRDCNNLAPRFGFAYRLGERWGVIRGAYGIHYGEIFNVTYGQARLSPPRNLNISVQVPDLANPLRSLGPEDFDPNARSTVFSLDPELATPYSHQYSFDWQLPLGGDWSLNLGYVGSRTHKLLTMWYVNRARIVEGIPQTTATVNERRPDPRFFDNRYILNGSRGYFDAAKAMLRLPNWKGLSLDASYWFSKAIDLGNNFSNTASGRDARLGRSQTEFNSQAEMRSVSWFDQPHALLLRTNWALPAIQPRWASWIGGWELSTVFLAKAGTPFDVSAGSDGEGFGNVDGSPGDRPNLLDPSILGISVDDPDTSRRIFNADSFAFIQPTDLAGNLGHNVFRKDGIFNVNAALSKRWPLGGDAALTLRAESLNVFNHPQFAEPGKDLTSPSFGQITNTLNDGRAFKFTLQLDF